MNKRYLYTLLFGIPGFFVSRLLSLMVFGASIGFLWIYVFGDNTWPASMETMLTILFVLVFLALWIVFIILGYRIGTRLENDPAVNKQHILISGGLTLLFILIIIFQQLSVGNLGPRSDSVLCSDVCAQKGYLGSGMPPENSGERTCSCYDASGNEALTMPLDSISK